MKKSVFRFLLASFSKIILICFRKVESCAGFFVCDGRFLLLCGVCLGVCFGDSCAYVCLLSDFSGI